MINLTKRSSEKESNTHLGNKELNMSNKRYC
jgi:hypothetical protein